MDRETVFKTPWFQVISQTGTESSAPYYLIDAPDFVSVVGLNPEGELLLVRQFRPAVGMVTLELPAGHVDAGETPEESARKELYEETGYAAEKFELLARLSPSTGRFTNRLHVFFAGVIRPAQDARYQRESGIEVVFHRGGLQTLLDAKEFVSMGSSASLFAALARGRIRM